MSKTVLIAGASGLVGTACVGRFLEDRWNVIAVSRRRPEVSSELPFTHRPIDLRDPSATRAALKDLKSVSHVVYAAVFEKPGLIHGWKDRDQMSTNLAMLRNLIDPLIETGALEHITLLQGTKAYGAHLHPIPVPAREVYPRDDHENFYWLQEDYVRENASTKGFTFTIMRPQLIVGPSYGTTMCLPPVIGAYAAICREEGRSFSFPGGPSYVWEAVDSDLVANAIHWAAESPAAAGQHFNLADGEVFTWRDTWPVMAQVLGVELGPDEPLSMQEFLPSKAALWDKIVDKHDLRKLSLSELLGESHYYADYCFAYGASKPPPPTFVSTVKIKQAGFTEVRSTHDTFARSLRVLQERQVLPRP